MTTTPRRPRLSTALTAREVQILDLVSYGLSNKEVARSLYITLNTQKTMLQRACRKLGARDRAHAVRRGIECGWLRLDQPPQAVANRSWVVDPPPEDVAS